MMSSASRTLAEGRIGSLSLRRRQARVKRFERRQESLHAGELDFVILYLRTQIVDGGGIGRGLMRGGRLCPGIAPHHIGDRVELRFLGGSDLQLAMQIGDVSL